MATFKKRTNLTGLTESEWMKWAIARTGVNMPNCVTYATARISEILGRKEYLDEPRITGAQELWSYYSQGFTRSKYAVPGALMIWESGQYGHVAVCEELLNTNTIAWSQSNYGGAMFEYVKGNPNGYKGMRFLGYLVHDKLPKAAASKPSTSLKDSSGHYKVGTPVTYTGLWTQSNGGKWFAKKQLSQKQGKITKVIKGAQHPYLIDNGIGWANNKCIDDEPTKPTLK
ncbi:CHAP domain-containing protein [[Clostridium] innocuum]|nr:CHAP domain-containing protein [[Clostridium] innocuum]